MPERIIIKTITLGGFRAFLQPQTFEFGAGRSLAVFAPNARGKSSLVDTVEFYLSSDGTLQRLGRNKTGNRAGREALEHVDAAANGITSQVTLTFHDGTGPFGDTRLVVSQNYARPASAQRVADGLRVPMLIHGYQLRRFVEDQTAEDRYEEIASWFSLSRLVTLQSSLKDLRASIKKKLNENSTVVEKTKDLVRLTGSAIKAWDETQVVAWLNTNYLRPLDAGLSLTALSLEDPAIATIGTRKDEEEKRVGLDTLKDAIAEVKAVYVIDKDGVAAGSIVSFEKIYRDLAAARDQEGAEKAKAEKAVFKDVWEAAAKLLDNKDVELSACPACATDFNKTAAGGREALSAQLATHLGHLKNYRDAVQAFDNAKNTAKAEWNAAKTVLEKLRALLKAVGHAVEAEIVNAYAKNVAEMPKTKAVPDSTEIKAALAPLLATIQAKHDAIVNAQGKNTYGKALTKIEDLIVVKEAIDAVVAKKAQLETLNQSLNTISASVDASIRAYVESIISALRADTNTLYQAIQGGAACPAIRLELPDPDDVNQRRLSLVIDFGPRTGVPPSGYLSDSQVHTLALALRLAAIRRLNKTVAAIVLDDVVTSYDADHRRYIAAMISTHLSEYQVIVVTHEDLFFKELRDVLPVANWDFKRIARIEPDFGPRFADHQTKDQEIEDTWRRGDLAANLMRQAEEEWLRRICLEFGVDARMKDFGDSYERSECAQALYVFLKEKRLTPPLIPGVANPFLNSLRDGVVENFGSHFQNNRYTFASAGDEQRRWAEFKQFRDIFKCPACGRDRFKRPGTLNLPVCKHRQCEAQFRFSVPQAAAAQAPVAVAQGAPVPVETGEAAPAGRAAVVVVAVPGDAAVAATPAPPQEG